MEEHNNGAGWRWSVFGLSLYTYIYRIVPKTTLRYMKFCQIKIRTINEVLQYLCSYNANSMAIFLPYIRGRVVIKVVLFSGLYSK